MTKKAATCPSNAPCTRAKVTSDRLAALSISSTHMKATIALRRVMKPISPMVNRIADRPM